MNSSLFEFGAGQFILILLLSLLLFLLYRIFKCKFDEESFGVVKKVFTVALIARIVWVVVYMTFISADIPFAISDDETYMLYASGQGGFRADFLNSYAVFLEWVYETFGSSTLNGRILSFFASVGSVFPLAYIEQEVLKNRKFLASYLYALLPFQVFWCFFEIKDVLLVLFYALGYACVIDLSKRLTISGVLALALVAFLSENLRSGFGYLLVAVLLFCWVGRMANFYLRAVVAVGGLIAVGAVAFSLVNNQYAESLGMLTEWVPSTYSETSLTGMLAVSSVLDIWKIPIGCIYYVIQPFTGLTDAGRMYFDYGFLARMFDIGINVIALAFVWRYIKAEKVRSLIALVPLIALVCLNPTNTREGIFFYPYLYIMFALAMVPAESKTSLSEVDGKGVGRTKFLVSYCICAGSIILVLGINFL